jgi:hypothetical protein
MSMKKSSDTPSSVFNVILKLCLIDFSVDIPLLQNNAMYHVNIISGPRLCICSELFVLSPCFLFMPCRIGGFAMCLHSSLLFLFEAEQLLNV